MKSDKTCNSEKEKQSFMSEGSKELGRGGGTMNMKYYCVIYIGMVSC